MQLSLLLLIPVDVFAQSGTILTGSYAFLGSAKQSDSFGDTGGAVLGVLNFDGAGNVAGAAVIKARTGGPQDGDTGTGAISGSYTTNSDGTANVTLEFTDFGFTSKLAMVITDSGKSIQFADGPGSPGPLALNPAFQGSPDRVTGTVPGGFFLQSFRPGAQAMGTVPLTLNRTYNDGVAIYSLAAPATGNGPVTCPDGTSGNWSATIPSATVVMRNTSGNFMMPVLISGCGGQDISNFSGLANLNPAPNGISVVLHLTGYFVVGSGRATSGAAPKGSYGVQLVGEPFPNANIQVLNFDGSGGVTGSIIAAGGTTAVNGTYSINSDGIGTITMNPNGPAAAPLTVGFVTADDGSTIYVLRTSGGAGGADIMSGIGHLQ